MKNSERPDIEDSIVVLEERKLLLLEDMKSDINAISETLKPTNLIKSVATGIMAPSNRVIVLKYITGAVFGFIARRYLLGGSGGIFKKLGGKAFIWAVRKLIFKI